ncbi:hypothetical protein AAGW05_03150 [Arthrobacter sp. LAPM80]|uniref:hypothetical protein n=1 Tax=Arthrobacter sp. LAPM80 TaxID=3141788 RepID=UPI00398B3E9B
MPRPHSEIPSQRLAVGRSQSVAPGKPLRAIWWTIGITLVGWIILLYPVVLLAAISLVVMTGSLDSSVTASGVTLGILGLLATLCMAAFPPLLGFAVRLRRRSLWILALLTCAVSIAACIYLTVDWLIPLG